MQTFLRRRVPVEGSYWQLTLLSNTTDFPPCESVVAGLVATVEAGAAESADVELEGVPAQPARSERTSTL